MKRLPTSGSSRKGFKIFLPSQTPTTLDRAYTLGYADTPLPGVSDLRPELHGVRLSRRRGRNLRLQGLRGHTHSPGQNESTSDPADLRRIVLCA